MAKDSTVSVEHWSKDYIEHLRSVHFAIVAASLALLVLALAPSPSDFNEARHDLRIIETLSVSAMKKAMSEEIRLRLAVEEGRESDPSPNLFLSKANAMVREGKTTPTRLTLEGTSDLIVDQVLAPVRGEDPFRRTQNFGSVSQFKDVWNAMATSNQWQLGNDIPVQNVYVDDLTQYPPVDGVSTITHRFIRPVPVKLLTVDGPEEAGKGIHFQARECEPTLKEILGGKFAMDCQVAYEASNIVMDGKSVMLFFPVAGGTHIEFGFQNLFSRPNGWSNGTFAESFPALSKLSQGIDEPSYAERVRTLRSLGTTATLSTVSRKQQGYPSGSLMPNAIDNTGRPILLISSMAVHTQNLQADLRASLFVGQAGDGDSLGTARATLIGDVLPVPDEELGTVRELYLSRYENSGSWVDFKDFAFYHLQPLDIYFVGGFGVMGWVAAEH
jgi:hypothetical protein